MNVNTTTIMKIKNKAEEQALKQKMQNTINLYNEADNWLKGLGVTATPEEIRIVLTEYHLESTAYLFADRIQLQFSLFEKKQLIEIFQQKLINKYKDKKILLVLPEHIVMTETGAEYTKEGLRIADDITTYELTGRLLKAYEILKKIKPQLYELSETGVLPYILRDDDMENWKHLNRYKGLSEI